MMGTESKYPRGEMQDLKEMFQCVCTPSHVPGMHVIVDELSSTILTTGHPAAMGGIVTKETCRTDNELKADRKMSDECYY